MLRVSPYHSGDKIEQTHVFRIEPGGSESNVAIGLARLGHKVSFITKIPDNSLKESILRYLHEHNVDSSYVIIGGERIGIYWTETGIGPRAASVIYDRENSSFSTFNINNFNWDLINKNAFWFHVSGIVPAISENSKKELFSVFNLLQRHIKISIDINFRKKLWKWIKEDHKAKKITDIMNQLCNRAYLLTGNESDLQDALGCPIPNVCDIESYKNTVQKIFENMPELRYMAISLRKSYSASENEWSGILFTKSLKGIECFIGPKYQLNHIVDRVGTGDSFTAGIIHGLTSFGDDSQHIIDFATTLSALNHTVNGDASQFNGKDVEHALISQGSGRIIR